MPAKSCATILHRFHVLFWRFASAKFHFWVTRKSYNPDLTQKNDKRKLTPTTAPIPIMPVQTVLGENTIPPPPSPIGQDLDRMYCLHPHSPLPSLSPPPPADRMHQPHPIILSPRQYPPRQDHRTYITVPHLLWTHTDKDITIPGTTVRDR